MRLNIWSFVLVSGFAALSFAQEQLPSLPPRITGAWEHSGWGGHFQVSDINLAAKTARATLGRGGDSCGFDNSPAVIKSWDGKLLLVVIPNACAFPIEFRLIRSGNRWEGQIDNDARTVSASGKDS